MSDQNDSLPQYADQLFAFHRAFDTELRQVVQSLPLAPHMRVLDVGCGDGYYMTLFAERLLSPGAVVGLDVNQAYLELARQQPAFQSPRCAVKFMRGELADASTPASSASTDSLNATCDLVWCAQSLYSLPEPVAALRQMAATVKPGGLIAVLENDTLHQLLLPWPGPFELALRAAELESFREETGRPAKYYVGRRLPAAFAEAGIEPLGFRTQCIDRQAPLSKELRDFLTFYLERLAKRVGNYLHPNVRNEFDNLINPQHSNYLLHSPHFTLSWINILTLGRRPVG